jgi:rhamnosyltransferase
VAVVGPSYVDLRQNPPMHYPFYRKIGWHIERIYCNDECKTVEVDALITSGSLYKVEVFNKIKLFDEGYFVDYIDTDWCFEARSLGFSLFGVCDATMSHELGSGLSRSFATIRLIEYSPLRRYYYFRNTIHFVRRSYVPWFWKLKLTFGLILRIILLPVSPGAQKWQQLAMMIRGGAHGLVGITGPFNGRS